MNEVSANKLITTAEKREEKLRMILEKAEKGNPTAIEVLKTINTMLKQM
ncbi:MULTISPECIES: hypothetical protein [Bacillus cereus group]|nr:hypothetical protein [Bacillus cereus]